jgi:hypothetical protein
MDGSIYKHSPYLHLKSRCSLHNYWKKTMHQYTNIIATMPFSYTRPPKSSCSLLEEDQKYSTNIIATMPFSYTP